jgi:hypothetical protein
VLYLPDTEQALSNSGKKTVTQFVMDIESIRMTNWFMRIAWKTSAGLIALTARLFTSIVLAIIRIARRNRSRW